MNCVTVSQLAQGFAEYMKKLPQNDQKVVIGYETRHYSKIFAQIIASVLSKQNIETYLSNEEIGTPIVAYLAKTNHYYGVMVTASHCQNNFNGVKVFENNGIQIIEPIDKLIQQEISNNQKLFPWVKDYQQIIEQGNQYLHIFDKQFYNNYFQICKEVMYKPQNSSQNIPTVQYSSMFGPGIHTFKHLVEVFNFDKQYIKYFDKECQYDSDFGGIPIPNPELDEVCQYYQQKADKQTNIIILNDNDADRLSICEKQQDGSWYHVSANELGDMLLLCNTINKNKIPTVISTVVSSALFKQIAVDNKIQYKSCLTGFKNIGRFDLQEKLYEILGFEVDCGYTLPTNDGLLIRDKDGMITACIIIEMCQYIYSQNKTLYEHMQEIYNQYGHYSYYGFSQYFENHMDLARLTFKPLLNNENNKIYPKFITSIVNNQDLKYKVVRIRDLQGKGYDSKYSDCKPVLPVSQNQLMITFWLQSPDYKQNEKGYDYIFTRRMSGTEPKVKNYFEYIGDKSITQQEADKRRIMFQQVIQQLDKQQ